jgi:hypothetical protein
MRKSWRNNKQCFSYLLTNIVIYTKLITLNVVAFLFHSRLLNDAINSSDSILSSSFSAIHNLCVNFCRIRTSIASATRWNLRLPARQANRTYDTGHMLQALVPCKH